jgi:hypothetical protein
MAGDVDTGGKQFVVDTHNCSSSHRLLPADLAKIFKILHDEMRLHTVVGKDSALAQEVEGMFETLRNISV